MAGQGEKETGIRVAGMMAETAEIPGGAAVEVINHPKDCPTILVEGMRGVALTENLVKIYFIEQLPIEGSVVGRHVLNMTIPVAEFSKLFEVFKLVNDQIALPKKQEA